VDGQRTDYLIWCDSFGSATLRVVKQVAESRKKIKESRKKVGGIQRG
jgi:hypothetical protein